MGKFLPEKGKVLENNECLKALVIFADRSFFDKYFPILNHKMIKWTLLVQCSRIFEIWKEHKFYLSRPNGLAN